MLKRVAEDTPRPIREIIPEMPQWLCDIIAKLHAKNPDDRFQSAREVADVLADCEGQLQAHRELKDFARIPEPTPRPVRRRSRSPVLVVVLVLVGLMGCLGVGRRGRSRRLLADAYGGGAQPPRWSGAGGGGAGGPAGRGRRRVGVAVQRQGPGRVASARGPGRVEGCRQRPDGHGRGRGLRNPRDRPRVRQLSFAGRGSPHRPGQQRHPLPVRERLPGRDRPADHREHRPVKAVRLAGPEGAYPGGARRVVPARSDCGRAAVHIQSQRTGRGRRDRPWADSRLRGTGTRLAGRTGPWLVGFRKVEIRELPPGDARPFVLVEAAGKPGRLFATLAEAVEASPAGGRSRSAATGRS